jgi:hemoglobin
MKMRMIVPGALAAAGLVLMACRSPEKERAEDRFFTSGSTEADQRASQRMARDEQLAETSGEEPAVEERKTLYERLGGEAGLATIVDDFIARVLQDPRVNWARRGVRESGFFSTFRRADPEAVHWEANPQQIARLKRHFVQFLSLATGGPPQYDGQEMKQSHAGMQITNPEFDAAIGDLKATLDRLHVADREQKELLAIMESTRPQIVTNR